MTREKEDKIIAQAQDILERRMAVETDIKINLHNLTYYSAYYRGARNVVENLTPYVMRNFRSDDKVYIKAELDLAIQVCAIHNCGLTEQRCVIATMRGTKKAN